MAWFHVESINYPSTEGTPLHLGAAVEAQRCANFHGLNRKNGVWTYRLYMPGNTLRAFTLNRPVAAAPALSDMAERTCVHPIVVGTHTLAPGGLVLIKH